VILSAPCLSAGAPRITDGLDSFCPWKPKCPPKRTVAQRLELPGPSAPLGSVGRAASRAATRNSSPVLVKTYGAGDKAAAGTPRAAASRRATTCGRAGRRRGSACGRRRWRRHLPCWVRSTAPGPIVNGGATAGHPRAVHSSRSTVSGLRALLYRETGDTMGRWRRKTGTCKCGTGNRCNAWCSASANDAQPPS